MLTDSEILGLIRSAKTIASKIPSKGYKEEDGHKRCEAVLRTTPRKEGNSEEFLVFIRQSLVFIENYSIGLRYNTKDKALGSITLVRYNGSHGETSQAKDGHFSQPHIHRLTAAELQSSHASPQEKHRELTDRYLTFEQALKIFFEDIGVDNYSKYFHGIQMDMFHGH